MTAGMIAKPVISFIQKTKALDLPEVILSKPGTIAMKVKKISSNNRNSAQYKMCSVQISDLLTIAGFCFSNVYQYSTFFLFADV